MTLWRFLAGLGLAVAIALGGYAYWVRGKYVMALDVLDHEKAAHTASAGELTDCSHARDVDKAEAEKKDREAMSSLSASRTELDELRAQRAEADKRLAAFRALTEKFRKMIDSGKLQVTLRHGRMIVKLPAGILFASGSAELSKEGQAAITDVAGILKQVHDRHFMVAGHTDNVPVVPPSPFKNNLQLSTARAETVTEQLIAAGMSPAKLAAAGYSEYEPVRENGSESGRQENRRIEIILLPNLAELPQLPDIASPAPSAAASGASAAPSAAPSAPSSADASPPPPKPRR